MTSTAIGLLNNVVTLWESFFMSALILVAGFAYYGVIGALTSSIQVRAVSRRHTTVDINASEQWLIMRPDYSALHFHAD